MRKLGEKKKLIFSKQLQPSSVFPKTEGNSHSLCPSDHVPGVILRKALWSLTTMKDTAASPWFPTLSSLSCGASAYMTTKKGVLMIHPRVTWRNLGVMALENEKDLSIFF